MKKKSSLNKVGKITSVIILVVALSFVGFKSGDDFKISKSLDIFYTLFREVNMFYVDETNPEKLVRESIDAMLESLDPYTVFIPEENLDEFKFMTTGQYGGIGALIRKKGDYALISQPYKGFPADLAGLRTGDMIFEIDGKQVKDMAVTQVSENLKGIPKTKLSLTIKRPYTKKKFSVDLVREEIKVSSVPYYGVLDNNIGYILVTKFTKDVAKEVKKVFIELKDNHQLSGIIVDVRGNPGGLLIESVHLSSMFVDKGSEIVSTKGKVKKWDQTYYTTHAPIDTEIPLVILVNRGSASSSEIFAGAIQDMDRGVIIGERTFGKGLVQTSRPLSYNAQLKVTTAKYYIPSGRCIQALDYTNRNEDGSVGHIPDSLISEFQTKNGRKVYDGGGIITDVSIKAQQVSEVTIGLITKDLIFNYATYYSSQNESIGNPSEFKFSDEDYIDFLTFVEDKEFTYDTRSEEKLKELIKIAKREKYYELAVDEFDALRKKLSHDREKDLQSFKEEIIQFLEEEIVSRYYYQSGYIGKSLESDFQLDKAIEILTDEESYRKILSGDYKKEKTKNGDNI